VGREDESVRFIMRIEEEQQGVIPNLSPARIDLLNRIASQSHPQTVGEPTLPILIGHLFTVGPEPREVLDLRAADLPTMEKLATAQYRVLLPVSRYAKLPISPPSPFQKRRTSSR
jgi:hypothetical protein